MAVGSMFIKIDGIEGESKFGGHEKEIDIESFNIGVTQPGTGHVGGGSGAGRAQFGDLNFMHSMDRSSPNLFLYCANGTHIKSALLTVRKAGGDESLPFLKVEVSDCIISSCHPSGNSSDLRPMESVTLNYAKVKMEYQEQDEKGKAKGGPVAVAFDVKTNKKV